MNYEERHKSKSQYTYIADSEFESHVTNFYPWSRDKLIIGKFCQIAAGNPAKAIRKRFDDELISLMLKWKWRDKTIEEIDALIPVLTGSDLEEVKEKIKSLIGR